MRIADIIAVLEQWAPPSLQEEYDNCGLQVGDQLQDVDAALVCLDCTEDVVAEAVSRNCGLIISHHPVIFKGLKRITGGNDVERTVLAAIKHGIALYAIHTNLDNVFDGVNAEIAGRMGLKLERVLEPKAGVLRKLVVFAPTSHAEAVRQAMFNAGAGRIGNYDECSYNLQGMGTFRAGEGANPYVGKQGERHQEEEVRLEVIYEVPKERAIVQAMKAVHPYEAVAYDLYSLENRHQLIGSGAIGTLAQPEDEAAFLQRLKSSFGVGAIRHTALRGKPVQRVAICGGSGAFLIGTAKAAGADAYVTGDIKYHQFFEAEGRLLLCDIGHYGSEQFTPHLVQRHLKRSLATFAVHLSGTPTDPIHFT